METRAYSTVVMQGRQPTNIGKIIRPASRSERTVALGIALSILALFGLLWYLERIHFDFGILFNPCGFKQRTGWPCPGCGMTRAVLAFARGDIVTAFYTQPAAALLCTALVIAAFFALPVGVLGVYFSVVDRLVQEVRLGHVVVGLLVILAAGWAVTLARALAS